MSRIRSLLRKLTRSPEPTDAGSAGDRRRQPVSDTDRMRTGMDGAANNGGKFPGGLSGF